MRMMKTFLLTLAAALSLVANAVPTSAWNLDAKHINALQFLKTGRIEFTLLESGTAEPEFRCSPDSQWFYITSFCPAGDQVCLASVNRMGSLLLAAKLSRTPVHVQRSGCEVTAVALKPM